MFKRNIYALVIERIIFKIYKSKKVSFLFIKSIVLFKSLNSIIGSKRSTGDHNTQRLTYKISELCIGGPLLLVVGFCEEKRFDMTVLLLELVKVQMLFKMDQRKLTSYLLTNNKVVVL